LASIAPLHEKLIKLSPTALGSGSAVPVTITDFSKGGIGIRASIYFPQGALVKVSTGQTGQEISALLRVQRAVMIDRSPSYSLGLAFSDAGTGQAFHAAMQARHAGGRDAA
jgi:hypothetical protein